MAAGRLHLHDVGAEVTEHLGAERRREAVGDLEDAPPLERARGSFLHHVDSRARRVVRLRSIGRGEHETTTRVAAVAFRPVQPAVPTTLDAVLDPDWLTEALDDIGDGDRIVGVEEVDSSKTLAQKVRFRVTVERPTVCADAARIA